MNLLSENQPNYGMEVSIGPVDMQQQQQQQQQQHSQGASSYLSAENSPFVGSTGTGEDDELSAEQEMQTPSTGDEPDIEVSKSKKRRERRLRLQKQFAVYKALWNPCINLLALASQKGEIVVRRLHWKRGWKVKL
ncbi:unnamed protein product [Gongylonema pulchrum]|uniref:Anaphase-promoting complex subunit 4-like WD40 domain-containing protein n=1 Tax=Gongylonema pulchrum TaxID=637853 RepID=A0A3P7P300_9BILA|nr:unnamed protein product [Gongylonema pulchrum]